MTCSKCDGAGCVSCDNTGEVTDEPKLTFWEREAERERYRTRFNPPGDDPENGTMIKSGNERP